MGEANHGPRVIASRRLTRRTRLSGLVALVAVVSSGCALAWGNNDYGQLGDGTLAMQSQPKLISAENWASISAGTGLHTCAVRHDGTAWCWGSNDYGQLGDGTTTQRTSPVQVGTETDWTSVSAGGYHTCGTRTDGTVWCWGNNSSGQLGDGTTTHRSAPVQVGTATNWTSVSAGAGHSCGIRTDGTAWCWGFNGFGELGDGTQTTRTSPVQVGTATNWASIAAGVAHSCGIRTDGTAWCWGWNASGGVGDGTTTTRTSPVQVGSDSDWVSISAGAHSCGIRTDGAAWCWGFNGFGELGDNTTTDRKTPVRVGSGNSAESGPAGTADASVTGERREPGVPAATISEIASVAEERGEARVVVTFDTAFSPPHTLSTIATAAQAQRLADARRALMSYLGQRGQARLLHTYQIVPAVALTLDATAAAALAGAPGVARVEADEPVPLADRPELTRPVLADSIPQVNADDVVGRGYTGAGQVVAVLDTGVDGDHPMLSEAVIGQACYSSTTAGYSTSVCPGGVNSDTSGGGPCPLEISSCKHGTHVASIATGRPVSTGGTELQGVAPGASVYAIQIFSRFDSAALCAPASTPCLLAYYSDQLSGLDRVYALRTTHSFASVNMSLGGGKATTPCASNYLNSAISNLRSAGIAVVIASGNDAYSDGIGAPGCDPNAVSVGSVTVSDTVSSFSNSYQWLSILAPGSSVKAAVPGGGYETWNGTSMATPHVAGAFALLRDATPAADVEDLIAAITENGVPILDARNGFTFPRLDVGAALADLIGPVGYGDWVSISAGLGHSCGIRSDGTAWCWGNNDDGRLGDGTANERHTPVQVGTGTNWTSIDAGAYHTAGVAG